MIPVFLSTGVLTGGIAKRAERICDKEHLNKELRHLEEVFGKNGFPKKVVQKTIMNKIENKKRIRKYR